MKRDFRTYHTSLSFVDVLFNLVLGVTMLFILAMMLISVQPKKANITTKAEFVITLTWDEKNNDDIDIWIEDPAGEVVFFREKEKGLTHLDRDDLGDTNDTVLMPDGTTFRYPYNQEIVTIRGIIPGEWTVNVHMYRKKSTEILAIAEVKVEKLNPSVTLIAYQRIELPNDKDEKTVVRFTMDNNGNVLDLHRTFKSLTIKKLESVFRGTGV